MGETYLSRPRNTAAAHKSHCGSRVAHRPERTLGDERLRRIYLPGNGIYLRCFNAFFKCYRRHDGRDTLGEHGFSRPGRSQHEQIVRASRRDLYRGLRLGLPHHVREIRDVLQFAPLRYVLFLRGKPGAVFQKFNDLGKVLRPVDCYPIGNACLLGVRFRQEYALHAVLRGGENHRQRSVYRGEFAVERQLPDEGTVRKICGDHSAQLHQRGDYRQVEHRAYFPDACRGEIHCDAAVEKLQVELTEHRPDTRLALLHGNIRHSHDVESGLPGGNTRLDRYHECV